jgi:phospholipase/carboxylesterase
MNDAMNMNPRLLELQSPETAQRTPASPADPHRNAPVLHLGASIAEAAGAVVLLHGRGASAEDILGLAPEIGDGRLAYLAPQATGSAWYPQSFLAPRAANEPWLSSALAMVQAIVVSLESQGVPRSRIVLAGFSQGACLSTEFVATHPARYAGVIAFTGGLIGPPGSHLTGSGPDGEQPAGSADGGTLAGTPVFFGSGDPDPHVPWSRVEESAAVLRGMGAEIEMRRYPGRPHTVSRDELVQARALVARAFA